MPEITVACFREYKLDLRTCRIGTTGTIQSFVKYRNIEIAIENSFMAVELYVFGERNVAANYFVIDRSISRIKFDRVEKHSR